MKFMIAPFAALLSVVSALPGDTTIYPDKLSLYTVSTGAVAFNTPTGKVFKDGRSSDITTLLTFTIPSSASGKLCEFNFALNSCLHCNPGAPTGTAQFDVYSSLKPANRDTSTWPDGDLRNQYIGRLKVVKNGLATNVDGYTPVIGKGVPCQAGQVLGYELVGAGDQVLIQWDGKGEGPYIRVY